MKYRILVVFGFAFSVSTMLSAQESDTTYFWTYKNGQKSYFYSRKGQTVIEQKWTENGMPTLYRKTWNHHNVNKAKYKGSEVLITYYDNGKTRWKVKTKWKDLGNAKKWNAWTGKPKKEITVRIHWDENGKRSRTRTVAKK